MQFPKNKLIKDPDALRDYSTEEFMCEFPWCGLPAWLGPHHIIFRSKHHLDIRDNLISLCQVHHTEAHGVEARAYKEIFAWIKMLKLKYEIEPIAHQSVRQGINRKTGNRIWFQPKRIVEYGKIVEILTQNQLPYDFKMYTRDIPLKVDIAYYFKFRKRDKKKDPFPKITKPDLIDNLQKKLIDSLAGIVFEQDQQIYDLHVRKFWHMQNGIIIHIEAEHG